MHITIVPKRQSFFEATLNASKADSAEIALPQGDKVSRHSTRCAILDRGGLPGHNASRKANRGIQNITTVAARKQQATVELVGGMYEGTIEYIVREQRDQSN